MDAVIFLGIRKLGISFMPGIEYFGLVYKPDHGADFVQEFDDSEGLVSSPVFWNVSPRHIFSSVVALGPG